MEFTEQRLMVPVDLVDVDPDNANDHDKLSIESIRASLEKFGQQKPVVVKLDGDRLRCVAGSGTRIAAGLNNWLEIWVTITDLDERLASAYGIADNQTAKHSNFNEQKLGKLLTVLRTQNFPVEYLGFKDDQIQGLIRRAEASTGEAVSQEVKERITKDALAEGDRATNAKPIVVTPEMRLTIDRAIEKVRLEYGEDMTEGRAIELVCAEFLSGN